MKDRVKMLITILFMLIVIVMSIFMTYSRINNEKVICEYMGLKHNVFTGCYK